MLARRLQKFTSVAATMLLCLMLLCAQGQRLHVHYLDCEEEPPSDQTAAFVVHGHADHSKVHLITDDAHHHHIKAGMMELDISPQGLLKHISGSDPMLLVIIYVLILLLPGFTRLLRSNHHNHRVSFHQYYALSPPLRAPPLG